ncbi:hypothetical protein [Corynebacterium macginleyi]|uniref:hypothetical protein n=1 Tax=Corynebacterium macginleyi TaxID=38290 RepID=UPI00190D355E|nr:hypothetical protein [Corynebacterium macginleyi]
MTEYEPVADRLSYHLRAVAHCPRGALALRASPALLLPGAFALLGLLVYQYPKEVLANRRDQQCELISKRHATQSLAAGAPPPPANSASGTSPSNTQATSVRLLLYTPVPEGKQG